MHASKTITITFILLSWAAQILAQPIYFETLSDHTSWTERSSNAAHFNDSIYWITAGFDFAFGGGTHLSFHKIGNEGQLLRKTENVSLSGRYEAGHIMANEDGILCLSSFNELDEGTDKFAHMLTAFDTVGIITWQRSYPDSGYDNVPAQVIACQPYGFLTVGQRYDAISADMGVIRVDSIGEEMWRKVYGGANYEAVNSVVQTPDGGFLLLGWTRSFGSGQRDFYLVKTDSVGDQQWQRTYGGGGDEGGKSIMLLTDGNYLLTGSGSLGSSGSIGRIYKVTPEGNTIWSETYAYPDNSGNNLHRTVELPSGDLVSAGLTDRDGFNNSGYLIRTNDLGEVIWQREYDKNSHTDLFYSVLATDDGGFLLSGQAINEATNSQDAWMLKVDSIGCPYANCTVGISEIEKTVMVDVWPNPCSDVLNIEVIDPSASLKVTVTDMSGRTVLNTPLRGAGGLDVSAWTNGIYILQGTDEKGRSFSVKVVKR